MVEHMIRGKARLRKEKSLLVIFVTLKIVIIKLKYLKKIRTKRKWSNQ